MRDFHLLIDVGNTFLKWGLFQPSAAGGARENRLESGHALLEEIPALPAQFAKYPAPSRIVISNVAGTRVRAIAGDLPFPSKGLVSNISFPLK